MHLTLTVVRSSPRRNLPAVTEFGASGRVLVVDGRRRCPRLGAVPLFQPNSYNRTVDEIRNRLAQDAGTGVHVRRF
ncbi:MAG: hypothetical protein ACLSHC_09085 [Bilophila wadsworthia]